MLSFIFKVIIEKIGAKVVFLILFYKFFNVTFLFLKYKAEEIEQLALAPSDFAKLSAISNATQSVLTTTKTDVGEYNRELVYFFSEYIKERKTYALMQRLNLEFDSKMRIYHDPWASETMGLAVGGIQVTGGLDKSYFVKYDGKVTRIFKKDYDDDFKTFFGNCPELNAKYKNAAWRDFPDHVYFLDKSCK